MNAKSVCGVVILLATTACSARAYKATTYYPNNWCEDLANAYELTSVKHCSSSACGGTTYLGQKTSMGLCDITDPDEHAVSVFGPNDPYLYVRVFTDDACTSEDYVFGGRLFDGNCFQDSSTTSYSFSVRTDWSILQRFYGTPNCAGTISLAVSVDSYDVVKSNCAHQTKWFVRQANFSDREYYAADAYYFDGPDCQRVTSVHYLPIDVFRKQVKTVTCEQDAQGRYYATHTTSDFNFDKYVEVREYVDSHYCHAGLGLMTYAGDGRCIALDKTASATFSVHVGGSFTKKVFDGTSFKGNAVETFTMDDWYAHGGECVNGRTYYWYPHETPAPTTPTPHLRGSDANFVMFSIVGVLTIFVGAHWLN